MPDVIDTIGGLRGMLNTDDDANMDANNEARSCKGMNAMARFSDTRCVHNNAIVTAGLKWAPEAGMNEAASAAIRNPSGVNGRDFTERRRENKTNRNVDINSAKRTGGLSGGDEFAIPGGGVGCCSGVCNVDTAAIVVDTELFSMGLSTGGVGVQDVGPRGVRGKTEGVCNIGDAGMHRRLR